MLRTIRFVLGSALLSFVAAGWAQAEVITFENFAPPGGLVNVNPGSPYNEAGFRLTPSNDQSAVFDSAAGADMPGNTTDFFGFAENNIITLTNIGGAAFNLNSLLLGPTTIGAGTISMTVVGNFAAGGTISVTFSAVTTATLVTFSGFNDLSSVVFRTTDDSGLDDINVTVGQVPEPTTMLLLGTGLVGVAAKVRQRRRRKSI